MDYGKLVIAADAIVNSESKRTLFEYYVLQYLNEIHDEIIKNEWLKKEYCPIVDFYKIDDKNSNSRYGIKVVSPALKFIEFDYNRYDFSTLIHQFESQLEEIRTLAFEKAKFMSENKKNIYKVYHKVADAIRKFEFLDYDAVTIDNMIFDKVTGRMKCPIYYKTDFTETFTMLLPLYTEMTDELIDKCIKEGYRIFKKAFVKYRLQKYYDSYGKELSLNDKFLFVDYAYEQKDIDFAKKLNEHRSNLPKHLKSKLDAVFVLDKLTQAN